jgi:uncharacterized protein YggE
MADTIITVQGEYSAWYPAERATARVTVSFNGPQREPAFNATVEASTTVRGLIEAKFDRDAGPITWWSSDAVRVSSHRPWNKDGKQLPPVYTAGISFAVKFKDFAELARWVEAVAEVNGATVNSLSWDLTEATKTSATVEVRSRAVKDAVAKATVFAQSIGLAQVTAIALADPGMLGDQSSAGSAPGGGAYARSASMKSSDAADGGLELKPEDISVSSSVDARFIAS